MNKLLLSVFSSLFIYFIIRIKLLQKDFIKVNFINSYRQTQFFKLKLTFSLQTH